LKGIVGAHDDEALGIGEPLLASRRRDPWTVVIGPDARLKWARENVPHMLDGTPGGRDALLAMVDETLADVVRKAQPADIGSWTSIIHLHTARADLYVRYFGTRVRGPDGRGLATVYLYGSNLPAQLLALVTQGSRPMFERMARLIDPGRREAAVLFADVQASGALSRQLPSAAYFELMRSLTTSMDAAVIVNDGIVGKHAGDGLVAFFLVEDTGSPSACVRQAIRAARGLERAAAGASVQLNIGLHWGGMLYMGQITTGGRLEVTALGDEVNECARMEQAARDGAILASKALIERLSAEDAAAVGIDPEHVLYQSLAELPGADEKTIRDAGTLAVTDIAKTEREEP
jgi:class 3 adenylate cyclase